VEDVLARLGLLGRCAAEARLHLCRRSAPQRRCANVVQPLDKHVDRAVAKLPHRLRVEGQGIVHPRMVTTYGRRYASESVVCGSGRRRRVTPPEPQVGRLRPKRGRLGGEVRWHRGIASRPHLQAIFRREVPPMERTYTTGLAARIGERVRIAGWLHGYRQLGGIGFAVVRDGRGTAQVVCSGRLDLTAETVLEVEGTVVESVQAPGGVELHEPAIRVISEPAEPPPIELRRPELKEQ